MKSDTLTAKVRIKNTGKYAGEEIIQLYIRDMVGSLTRPVKELKDFTRVTLEAGESKEVVFKVSAEALKFYGPQMKPVTEPGDFRIYIGGNSRDVSEVGFKLIKNNN